MENRSDLRHTHAGPFEIKRIGGTAGAGLDAAGDFDEAAQPGGVEGSDGKAVPSDRDRAAGVAQHEVSHSKRTDMDCAIEGRPWFGGAPDLSQDRAEKLFAPACSHKGGLERGWVELGNVEIEMA